ncbi:MAG TPA: hypothetical protein VEU77_13600 [Candidatus Acidoferrales bacterium]|nr:hypothetical protein [Candidatus Acidoferrales bacterium]
MFFLGFPICVRVAGAGRRTAREQTERESLRSTGLDARSENNCTNRRRGIAFAQARGRMAGYADTPVPRGTSRRWEVLMSNEESERRPAQPHRTAADVAADHRVLREVPETLLGDIPLVDQGLRLERRGEYLDLHDPARADFRAEGTEVVKPGQHIVARAAVSDEAWVELRAACDRVVRRRPGGRGPRLLTEVSVRPAA